MADPILDIDLSNAPVPASTARARVLLAKTAKPKPEEPGWIRRLGGRKFFLTLLAFVTTTVLVVLGILPAEEYRWCMSTIMFTFITGNVVQKATEQKEPAAPSTPPTY